MYYPPLNYKDRCVNMNILPLSFRREMADIKLFFKSMESKLVRTETYKGYFSNRIVTLWNKLPPELRLDHSLDIFVGELDNFSCNKFKDTFTSIDICSWRSTCRCQACACF